MGLFKKDDSIIHEHFKLLEDVAAFSKNYMYDVVLFTDHLEIVSLQKKKLTLNYDQITDVFYGVETQLKEKSKSVIGRAFIGNLLFGLPGAVIGAAAGCGKKDVKERHFFFIISYTGSDGVDHYLQFEDTRLYKGQKLATKLKDLTNLPLTSQPDVTQL